MRVNADSCLFTTTCRLHTVVINSLEQARKSADTNEVGWLQLNDLPASTPSRGWFCQVRMAAATLRCLVDDKLVPGWGVRQADDQCRVGSRASFNPGHVSRPHITCVSNVSALCSTDIEASTVQNVKEHLICMSYSFIDLSASVLWIITRQAYDLGHLHVSVY